MSNITIWGSQTTWANPETLLAHQYFAEISVLIYKTSSSSREPEYTFKTEDNNKCSQDYSAIDAYLKQPELHEQVALGYGTSNKKKAIRKHKIKAKQSFKETDKILSQ